MKYLYTYLWVIIGTLIPSITYAALADGLDGLAFFMGWVFIIFVTLTAFSLAYFVIGALAWKEVGIRSGKIIAFVTIIGMLINQKAPVHEVSWIILVSLLIIYGWDIIKIIWKIIEKQNTGRWKIKMFSLIIGAFIVIYWWAFLLYSNISVKTVQHEIQSAIPLAFFILCSMALWVWINRTWLKKLQEYDMIQNIKIFFVSIFLWNTLSYLLVLFLHARFFQSPSIDVPFVAYILPFFGITLILWSFILRKTQERYGVLLILWIFLVTSLDLISAFMALR